jgi:hypothetical protein
MDTRRQVSENEKQAILEGQGNRCFIDNAPFSDPSDVEFDHINPFAEGGRSEIANIGAVCRRHNREKSTLSLSEYRDRLALKRFFEGARKRRLDDLLESRLGPGRYGMPLQVELSDGSATIYTDRGNTTASIEICPATGERYFFATLPFANIRNDVELQPRPLEVDRVWELYKHLRSHTQLAPAVCRLSDRNLLLFDGQHKAAAQVWAGRSAMDCKVYIEPEIRRLKETNLSAHDRLRQMPFYTSTLLEKYADMASEDWEAFLLSPGSNTERAFGDFMRARANLTQAEAVRRVRSMIYRDVLDDPQNRFRDYITEENRGRANPITYGRLEKAFFAEFIAPPPLNDEFETEPYHRDEERDNLVRLLNLVVDHVLADRWAPERNDAGHRKAARLFSAGALRAWVPFLRDAIAPTLHLYSDDDKRRIFYRDLDDRDFREIESHLRRLLGHKVWVDESPELADLRYDNAQRAKDILRSAGLTPAWILGAES